MLMASMTTPVVARMASLANIASPESTCATGDHARTEPSVRTGMDSTFVTVPRDSRARIVTRLWTGAPATLVRMEQSVLSTEPLSPAPVPADGLARCVM